MYIYIHIYIYIYIYAFEREEKMYKRWVLRALLAMKVGAPIPEP